MALSPSTASILNNLRQDLKSAGLNLGDFLSGLDDAVNAGNLGISALPADVDAVAKDGGQFAQDVNHCTGLYWAWFAGVISWQGTLVAYAANGGAPLLLSASNNNYVEAKADGTVVTNTVGWTAGYVPLWLIATSSSGINSVVRKRPVISTVGLGGITGTLASVAMATRTTLLSIGAVAATTTVLLLVPPGGATLSGVRIAATGAIATDDTNYWTFDLMDKVSGAGTTPMLAANTTKTTGGSAIVAADERDLILHGTPGNLVAAAGDVLAFTITKTGTPAALAGVVLAVDWKISG